jgi:hypothetical protein
MTLPPVDRNTTPCPVGFPSSHLSLRLGTGTFVPTFARGAAYFRSCAGPAAISTVSFLAMARPKELMSWATITNEPRPPMTLSR